MVELSIATKNATKKNSSLIKCFILSVLTFNPQICYLSLKIASQTAHSCSIPVGRLSMEMVSTDAHMKRLTIYAHNTCVTNPIYMAGNLTNSNLTQLSL